MAETAAKVVTVVRPSAQTDSAVPQLPTTPHGYSEKVVASSSAFSTFVESSLDEPQALKLG